MIRFCVLTVLIMGTTLLRAQQISFGVGAYTGITSSFTLDDGISEDPRYTARYQVKFAPIGAYLGVDYEAIGIGVSPGIINLGQTFYVVNTVGGQNGRRELDLQYLQIPVAFKVHIINLSFFRVSGLVSIAPAYLLEGKEVVSHSAAKLRFPEEVYPILPPDYTVEYDGVLVPAVDEYVIAGHDDFNNFQLFAAAGIRFDWDVSDHWRVSLDFRMNYGLYDSRTDEFKQSLEAYQNLYALPGTRHDMFAHLSLGIARFINLERRDIDQRKRLKGNKKGYRTTQYPYPKPRNKKPKG